MATYPNISETCRVAINRTVALTEKEKRLLKKAFNTTLSPEVGGTLSGDITVSGDLTTTGNLDVRGNFNLPEGDITASVGNFVIGTSGKGIDFSETSDAAGATSELLDDYEEGTWTASIAGNGGGTPVTVTGVYVKVGKEVYAQFSKNNFDLTGHSGGLEITGWPYNADGIHAGSHWSAGSITTVGSETLTLRLSNATANFAVHDSLVSGATVSAGSGKYLSISIVYTIA